MPTPSVTNIENIPRNHLLKYRHIFSMILIIMLLVAMMCLEYISFGSIIFTYSFALIYLFLILVISKKGRKLINVWTPLIPLGVFFWIVIFAWDRSDIILPYDSSDFFGTDANDEWAEIDVWISVGSFNESIENVLVAPVRLEYRLHKDEQIDEICINEVYLGVMNFNVVGNSFEFSQTNGQICENITDASFELEGIQLYEANLIAPQGLSLFRDNVGYLYPFDAHHANIVVQVTYSLLINSQVIHRNITIPSLHLYETGDSWDLSKTITLNTWTTADQESLSNILNFSDFEDTHRIQLGPYYEVEVLLLRPLLIRMTSVLIIAFIAIVIAITAIIEDTGTYVEATLAILFGLFSMRQLILPADLADKRILLDVVLIGLYIELGFSSTIFLLRKKFFSKTLNVQEINIGEYISRKSSNIFHHKTCRLCPAIGSENQVSFIDISSATQSGRRPCKLCCTENSNDEEKST